MKADEYLRKVTKIIYDSKRRKDISSELRDCIEDMTEAFEEQGMSREEAEAEAVRQMGSPSDVGELFNKVYRPEVEWKMGIYILVCAAIAGMLNVSGILAEVFEFQEIVWFQNVIGIFFILFGFVWSGVEKYMDLPFLYAWAQNWRGGGITNSGLFCGIGVGLAARNRQEWLLIFLILTILVLIQRSMITAKHNAKEQKYLWEVCTALEDIEFRGKADFQGEKAKIQMKKGEKAQKGDVLLIVGMDGFTLVAEVM